MYKGIIIKGDGRGKKMGFPTLNILMKNTPDLQGVFIVSVFIDTKKYFGLLHLGPRPTFCNDQYRIEIYILDFNSSIPLDTKVSFTIVKKIREIKKFISQDQLIKQISKDEIFAREYLRKI